MNRTMFLLTMALLGCALIAPDLNAEEPGKGASVVTRIHLDNAAITPITTHFIERALREAESAQAQCLVIELDTPGGLLDSTQQIVKDILASPVPIVVYVSPSGSRAASAGVFITLASHVAAMAPGTRIGAAHPVGLGGLPGTTPSPPNLPGPAPATDQKLNRDDQKLDRQVRPSVMEEKLVNDTTAWARGLAKLRGRNGEWAELAVSKSESIIAAEAVKQRVVDLIASDLPDLLKQIDGREIKLRMGTGNEHTVVLRTANATVVTIEEWWGEQLLGVVSNPNVALLLMMFGVYGILHELFSPGWGVSGTLGVISLVLAFFGLSVLPINYAGLALVIVALALFAAEPFFAGHGILAIGGIVCLIFGGTMLVDSPSGFMKVSLDVLVPVAVGTAVVVVFLVSRIIKAQRSEVRTGSEAMKGEEVLASSDFQAHQNSFTGKLMVHGEWWDALSETPIVSGEKIRIDDRQGLTLLVSKNGRPSPSRTGDVPDDGSTLPKE